MIFRPDIKPPMWGPPDAVQFAVRQNAERMGIDPASIGLLLPLWAGAGNPRSVESHGYTTTKYGANWGSRGLSFAGQQNNTNTDRLQIDGFDQNSLFGSNETTLFVVTHKTDNANLNELFAAGGQNQKRFLLSDDERVANEKVEFSLYNVGWAANAWTGAHLKYNEDDSLCLTWDGASSMGLYLAGQHISNKTGIVAADFPTTSEPLLVGAGSASVSSSNYWGFKGDILEAAVFNCVLSDNQIAQLHETPYALLMPVARPFIFDMAGGGGTLVTALADLRGTIRNNIQRAADLRAAISTPQAAQADTLTKISRALSQTADSRARISNLQAALSDSKAAVSNTLTQIADTKVSVSEQQQVIVPADTRVGVSNAQSALADLLTALSTTKAAQADTNNAASNTLSATADTRSALSNAIAAQADLSAAVHNQITAICDTRVQVMSDKTVVVSFDTLAKVSNVIAATADSKAAISQPVITAADCRAAISQLATAQADTRTAASNSVTASADTQIIISGLVQVVARCGTLVSVSSLASALADLKVIVGPSGIALSTADIDAIATAVWQKILADETGEGTASQIVQAIRGETEKARKMQTNKAIISGDGQTVSIYDDDGTTLLHVFTVSGDKLSRTPQ